MFTIKSETMKNLIELLVQVPDVDDMIINNKELCVKTNSGDYVRIPLDSLDIPDQMTITDFGVKSKVIKVLSDDWSHDIQYLEDDSSVFYQIGSQMYHGVIPMINNPYSADKFKEYLQNAEELFTLNVNYQTFSKIKAIIELYKAYPTIVANDKGMTINITSSSKVDKFDIKISDKNLFGEAGIELKDPLKLHRELFSYSLDQNKDCIMTFFKDQHKILVKSTLVMNGFVVEYLFVTTLSETIEDLVDINGIDLDLGI